MYEIYGNKLVFVAFKDTNYNDYTHFIEKTGLNIEYYNPMSVCDLAVAINSCKLFVGVPSGFMAMAVALNVKIIMGYPNITAEHVFMHGLDRYINNISHVV
jgi:ADP-heptose:LPS heptosyltransferase